MTLLESDLKGSSQEGGNVPTADSWKPSELAAAISGGDKSAESVLISRYSEGVLYILGRGSTSPSDAEDLLQDCLLVALRRLRAGSLDHPEQLEAYLHGIARRLLMAHRRKLSRAEIPVAEIESFGIDTNTPLAEVEKAEIAIEVRSALAKLGMDRDRELLWRRYILDQDSGRIQNEMSLSETGLRKALQRARRRLRSILGR